MIVTKHLKLFFVTLSLCAFMLNTFADELAPTFPPGLTVDLRHPKFKEGLLSTDEGGVITAPGIRIQARNILYSRRETGAILCAEGDLMVEMNDVVFVGDRLEYNFITNQGTIINGRASIYPWFFGGSKIDLLPDGSYCIDNAFVTTSENIMPDWQIRASHATVTEDRTFIADNLQLRLYGLPLFWLPCFKANLYTLIDSPFRYNFKWGGRQGPRIGIIYELTSWERFKAFTRFDYRFTRGPGGGLETYYQSEDRSENFETINYIARDSTVEDPDEKVRYRFQGIYQKIFWNDLYSLDITWDKISDKQMVTDYQDNDLELDTAGRTQLLLRRQDPYWIGSLLTRVRVNQFQSVNQEFPTLTSSWHPYVLGETGIISENVWKASYLDFTFSNDMDHATDFNAERVEFQHRFYRPISFGVATLTPEAGGVAILYNNSPQKESRYLFLGQFGAELNTQFYKYYSQFKHVIQPYARYEYYTFPSVSPHDHYIFSIDDGLYRLGRLKLGFRQLFFYKNSNGRVNKLAGLDIWTNLFYDTPTMRKEFPKVYSNLVFNSFETLRHTLLSAWDFYHNELEYFNFRTLWTLNDNFAIAGEYRHRDASAWRKVEYDNFILESFRPFHELLHSTLSDRRDTLLVDFYYRFHSRWALQFESRFGWHRCHEPAYREFEIDILTSLTSGWNLKTSYQHKEDEDRVAFYINLDLNRPLPADDNCSIPFLDF